MGPGPEGEMKRLNRRMALIMIGGVDVSTQVRYGLGRAGRAKRCAATRLQGAGHRISAY